jgi:hypothetical protein
MNENAQSAETPYNIAMTSNLYIEIIIIKKIDGISGYQVSKGES